MCGSQAVCGIETRVAVLKAALRNLRAQLLGIVLLPCQLAAIRPSLTSRRRSHCSRTAETAPGKFLNTGENMETIEHVGMPRTLILATTRLELRTHRSPTASWLGYYLSAVSNPETS